MNAETTYQLQYDREEIELIEKRRDMIVLGCITLAFLAITILLCLQWSWATLLAIVSGACTVTPGVATVAAYLEISNIHRGRLERLRLYDMIQMLDPPQSP